MLIDVLRQRASDSRDKPFCYYEDDIITFGTLAERVSELAAGLATSGIGAGEFVGVMLPSHPDHIYTLLALAQLGAVHVPVNVRLKSSGIRHILSHTGITTLIADTRYRTELDPAMDGLGLRAIRRFEASGVAARTPRTPDTGHRAPAARAPAARAPDSLAMILHTSGTTGPQKGVMVTDRMYQTAAKNAGVAADVRPGDVLFLWEPLHHVAGVQTVILCLQQAVACAMVERFSASQFWTQVRRYGATQIHYLGGVLGILMQQPERPDDADNPVRIAYGAPAPAALWPRFERRFGVQIRECYGMTEASSFTTINTWGKIGSIGKPVGEFEVRIVDDADRELPAGRVGEIVQRELTPGVITRGYLGDPAATKEALRGGWLHTGDLGYRDAEGFYYFSGRKKDTIRSRGENVSAWTVEQAAGAFPGVEECAAIGVPAEHGEEDIKLFVRARPGTLIDPAAIIRWCEERLASFEVPRYVTFVNEFPKTASERIRKAELKNGEEGRGKREG